MEREFWKQVEGDMFDFQEYYDRIADIMPEDSKLVEIGVANGKSLIYLAEALLNRDKKFHLIGVDNCEYGGQEQRNTIIRNITKAGLGDCVEFFEMDSLTASCKFPDGLLDFVFIDSSHKFEHTKAEIRLWYRKLEEGGFLAGHDYREKDVRMAVDDVIPAEFTRPQHEETIFEATKVLIEWPTEKQYGVWEAKKIWFVQLR